MQQAGTLTSCTSGEVHVVYAPVTYVRRAAAGELPGAGVGLGGSIPPPPPHLLGGKPDTQTPVNHILLTAKTVSKRHARLEVDVRTGDVVLRDLQSRNGTFVNDHLTLVRNGSLKVTHGDRIRFGNGAEWFLFQYAGVCARFATGSSFVAGEQREAEAVARQVPDPPVVTSSPLAVAAAAAQMQLGAPMSRVGAPAGRSSFSGGADVSPRFAMTSPRSQSPGGVAKKRRKRPQSGGRRGFFVGSAGKQGGQRGGKRSGKRSGKRERKEQQEKPGQQEKPWERFRQQKRQQQRVQRQRAKRVDERFVVEEEQLPEPAGFQRSTSATRYVLYSGQDNGGVQLLQTEEHVASRDSLDASPIQAVPQLGFGDPAAKARAERKPSAAAKSAVNPVLEYVFVKEKPPNARPVEMIPQDEMELHNDSAWQDVEEHEDEEDEAVREFRESLAPVEQSFVESDVPEELESGEEVEQEYGVAVEREEAVREVEEPVRVVVGVEEDEVEEPVRAAVGVEEEEEEDVLEPRRGSRPQQRRSSPQQPTHDSPTSSQSDDAHAVVESLSAYAGALQAANEDLTARLEERTRELEKLSSTDWAIELAKAQDQVASLRHELRLEREAREMARKMADVPEHKRSKVLEQEAEQRSAVRRMLSELQRRQKSTSRRWQELLDENERLAERVQRMDEQLEAERDEFVEALRQRVEADAERTALIADIAGGDPRDNSDLQKQRAAQMLVQTVSAHRDRAREARAATHAAAQRADRLERENEELHARVERLQQLFALSQDGQHLQQALDQLEEVHASGAVQRVTALEEQVRGLQLELAEAAEREEELRARVQRLTLSTERLDEGQALQWMSSVVKEHQDTVAQLEADLCETQLALGESEQQRQDAHVANQRLRDELDLAHARYAQLSELARAHAHDDSQSILAGPHTVASLYGHRNES